VRILYTDQHKLHATDQVAYEGHPFVTDEVPARAEIILTAVQAAGLGPVSAPTDHGLDPILAVHDASFVEFLRGIYAESAAALPQAAPVFPSTFAPASMRRKSKNVYARPGQYAFGTGSPILEGTWTAAYWSAQCALTATDLVLGGDPCAYALCRPPGHHAAANLYGGYCYLNNAAIAARGLQTGSPAEAKIALLDVDYHHGNGTQEIFYADPSVLYCSLHAHPDDDYPFFWGSADPHLRWGRCERGEGAGQGYNRNWPLPQRIEDADYVAALDEALTVVRDFGPRYLVVSVGFDMAAGDPVGGFSVTVEGMRAVGQHIARLARDVPTVLVQEGGYLLEKLGENAVAFLEAFA
jgi:acetoin utilization deacetylase AcuC-like enzyme